MPAANVCDEPGDHEQPGLDEMVRHAEEIGLYDLPDDPPFERLPVERGPAIYDLDAV